MKHIVIDARLYGPKHTGLGRYTKNLLIGLKNSPNFNKYRFTLIVYHNLIDEIRKDLGTNFNYVAINLPHYTVREQIFFPFLLRSLHPDLVHFTHLDKPIFYLGKSVVTVHDLIRHFSKGQDTTTKNPLLYWPKYWSYLLMTKIIFLTSSIIVPSNFWHDYILKNYHLNPDKIITTYEAVDPNLRPLHKSYFVSHISNYLLYNGNLYPHKNIKVVFEALQKLPEVSLKIICARSIFSQRAHQLTQELGVQKQVEFLGYVEDKNFATLYQNAIALVHPSKMEGFSLTGLEAMALGCPVISSNASCLPEIHGDAALYFHPDNSSELITHIQALQKSKILRQKLIKSGLSQVAKFSWDKTAKETINFYDQLLG